MTGPPCEDGWRIDRIPGKPVRREGQRVLVPLWLLHDGIHQADLDLDLSSAEAELLHTQLCCALNGRKASSRSAARPTLPTLPTPPGRANAPAGGRRE